MERKLSVTFCQTYDKKPLAVIDGFPGGNAELTPQQLRRLADQLREIAKKAEQQDCQVFRKEKYSYTF